MATRPSTANVTVVAHRGSSGVLAEHTVAAYRHALEAGADALECDVRLTRDGVLVCVHDRRVDRTSNGIGVVSTLELADLAELDFGSWRYRRAYGDPLLEASWEEPDLDRVGVLTLERLLDLVIASERPVQLHIETKHPTRYAGLVERRLVDVLRSRDLLTPGTQPAEVWVLSYAVTSLRRIHAWAPQLPTVLNLDRVPRWLRAGTLPRGVDAAGVALEVLRAHPRYVERVHAAGGRVHVFTVDEPDDIDYVLDLGVDAVISNRPSEVLRHLGR